MQIFCKLNVFLVSLRQNYKSNIKHKERSLYEAHAELKNLLKGKKIQAFVKDMCLHAYPWTERIPVEYLEYKIFEEFRLRESTGEKTRIGLDKKLQVIPDVILFIKPGYRALNQGHCFTNCSRNKRV